MNTVSIGIEKYLRVEAKFLGALILLIVLKLNPRPLKSSSLSCSFHLVFPHTVIVKILINS